MLDTFNSTSGKYTQMRFDKETGIQTTLFATTTETLWGKTRNRICTTPLGQQLLQDYPDEVKAVLEHIPESTPIGSGEEGDVYVVQIGTLDYAVKKTSTRNSTPTVLRHAIPVDNQLLLAKAEAHKPELLPGIHYVVPLIATLDTQIAPLLPPGTKGLFDYINELESVDNDDANNIADYFNEHFQESAVAYSQWLLEQKIEDYISSLLPTDRTVTITTDTVVQFLYGIYDSSPRMVKKLIPFVEKLLRLEEQNLRLLEVLHLKRKLNIHDEEFANLAEELFAGDNLRIDPVNFQRHVDELATFAENGDSNAFFNLLYSCCYALELASTYKKIQ